MLDLKRLLMMRYNASAVDKISPDLLQVKLGDNQYAEELRDTMDLREL